MTLKSDFQRFNAILHLSEFFGGKLTQISAGGLFIFSFSSADSKEAIAQQQKLVRSFFQRTFKRG